MIGGEKRGQLSAFVGAERPCVPGVYAADLFAARKREGFDQTHFILNSSEEVMTDQPTANVVKTSLVRFMVI
jgi:hypothetical protein